MRTRLLAAITNLLLVGAALAAAPPAARAQDGPTPSDAGPTREAGAMTAQAYLERERGATPRLLPRYRAFHRDFMNDFGVAAPTIEDRLGVPALRSWLETKWGDAAVYNWIERGLALYARFQASTRLQKSGFDFSLETDDMAGGKLGVQMKRPLATGSVE